MSKKVKVYISMNTDKAVNGEYSAKIKFKTIDISKIAKRYSGTYNFDPKMILIILLIKNIQRAKSLEIV